MSYFTRYDPPGVGFSVVAGPSTGLTGFVVAAGRLPAGDSGPSHLHHGDELIRVLAGRLRVRVADSIRTCGADDVVVVPADIMHSFVTLTDVELEVISVPAAGQLFPQQSTDGLARLVEVYRPDMPWGRTPPSGFTWTSDEELATILRRHPGDSFD